MIYSLRGTLIYTDANSAVVECAGVGYKCTATHKTLAQLPKCGNEVMLYTYMAVREDSVDLYGFYDSQELDFFKLIISVNGIGPKLGISILSDFTPEQLAFFITTGDAKSISKANGVGAKTAQRIVLELKDKISKEDLSSGVIEPVGNAEIHKNASEAIEALVSIGFTQGEAAKAVSRFSEETPVEQIIKEVLKSISK